MNNQYPKVYKNISKANFLNEDIKNKAVVIFMSEDNYKKEYKKYQDTYFETTFEKAKETDNKLFIHAKDVGLDWGFTETPNERMLDEINRFLLYNKDEEIISVCDAGVARSGFVTFLLDVKNNNLTDVERFETKQDIEFDSRKGRYITNPAFTWLLLNSDVLTKEEKGRLEEIK